MAFFIHPVIFGIAIDIDGLSIGTYFILVGFVYYFGFAFRSQFGCFIAHFLCARCCGMSYFFCARYRGMFRFLCTRHGGMFCFLYSGFYLMPGCVYCALGIAGRSQSEKQKERNSDNL